MNKVDPVKASCVSYLYGTQHTSPIYRASPVVCSYEKFQPVNRDEKDGKAPAYKLKLAPVNLFRSCLSVVVTLSIRVTLLLQLNGILLKWEIEQISQNTATEAAKRPSNHAELKYFHPGQQGWSVHMNSVNRDRYLGWPGWPGSHMNTSEFLQRK